MRRHVRVWLTLAAATVLGADHYVGVQGCAVPPADVPPNQPHAVAVPTPVTSSPPGPPLTLRLDRDLDAFGVRVRVRAAAR